MRTTYSRNRADRPPTIGVRVPGTWRDADALGRELPRGAHIRDRRLALSEGPPLCLAVRPRDDLFPAIFFDALGRPLEARERRSVLESKVLVCLAGPGGSVDAVEHLARGVTALVRAGGAGVFVDNSGAVCTPEDWLDLDGAPFPHRIPALITRIRSSDRVFSIGMHVAGLRDAVVPRSDDVHQDLLDLTAFLEYSSAPASPIGEGDLVGDESGPQFQVWREDATFPPAGSAMHNPYGLWRLERLTRQV